MSQDTSQRDRSRPRYRFSDHGNTEQGGRANNHICRPGLVDIWSPIYSGGATTIRIFPTAAPGNYPTAAPGSATPEFASYRYSAEKNQFGDWIRSYHAVKGFGEPGVTFLTGDPAADIVEDNQMTPGWVLFRAIDNAVRQGTEQQGWAGMLRGGTNRGAMLPRPTSVYLVQGCIMQHGAKAPFSPPRGFGLNDKTVVFMMGASAGNALIAELNKIKEGYAGNLEDYENSMLHGDPVSLQHGRFITFYKTSDGDPRAARAATSAGWQQGNPNALGGNAGRPNDQIGYSCFLEPMFGGMPANLVPFAGAVAAKVQPWEDILHFPSHEEQARLLADKFQPQMILYAFRDYPHWIPESVQRRAVAATTHPMPGMLPPGMLPPGTTPPTAGWGQPMYGGPGLPPGMPQQQQFQPTPSVTPSWSATPPTLAAQASIGQAPGTQFTPAPQPQYAPPTVPQQPSPLAALPQDAPPPPTGLLTQPGWQGAQTQPALTAAAHQPPVGGYPPFQPQPPAQQFQPAAAPAAPGWTQAQPAPGWGMQQPAGQQPVARAPITDPALPTASMPPATAPFTPSAGFDPPPPGYGQQLQPQQQYPPQPQFQQPQQQFPFQPEQPQPNGSAQPGQPLTRVQQALQRAQAEAAARAGQPAA